MNRFTMLSLALATLCLTGCGDPNMPPVGEVHGQVTLNGKPVSDCQVEFVPLAGGRSSAAITDENGKYILKYKGDAEGALLGKHRVRLVTARSATRDDSGRVIQPGVKEKLPKEYNDETTQQVEVIDGDNPIDFEIVTK
ncbi:carboxypeptidase regulatory-like domain-containing protein [Bremerella cremea]|uniref:Carboxypeptidase regulatory-like domain-containing protein n=1 Tax=Bremerella cremea TaxID=1031537 RepID=A0A368KUN0_9BACT|nr:carboxypeptidase regulatory-like domain-containing protein [Bremerella cremea]RCS54079.1 carboxypeptidase regulatory-like domain-containing protein [Bremerella cremea]